MESRFNIVIERIKNGDIKLNMHFISSTLEMQMGNLRTEFAGDLNNYIVVFLDIKKVLTRLEHDGETRYPYGDLIYVDEKTINLIDFIEKGNRIIPPEIRFIKNSGSWKMVDGQHRLSIMSYLKLGRAPFLILKSDQFDSKSLA